MEQKCYSKQELALEYFPDATPEVASAHLRRWINLRLSGRAIGRKSFFRAYLQKKT